MPRTDRRRTPRMTVSDLAYVNLDSDNGGTILNISEGGLSFQARAPIRKTDRIRFWYSYRRRRVQSGGAGSLEVQATGISRFIEVNSELTWTDPTRKKGGLRFLNLSTEARAQIREWICQPELVTNKLVTAPVARKPPFLVAIRPLPNAIPEALDKLKDIVRRIRSIRLWRGFSGGLLVGVLASGFVTSTIYLANHGRAVGDSMIRIGERLGGKSEAKTSGIEVRANGKGPDAGLPVMPSAMPELMKGWDGAKVPRPEEKSVSEPVHESGREKAVPTPALAAFTSNKGAREEPTDLLPAYPTVPVPAKGTDSENREPGSAPQIAPPANKIVGAAHPSGLVVLSTAGETEPSKVFAVPVAPSIAKNSVGESSEKYLEVGKFKERLLASEKNEELGKLGFPSIIVSKNRFLGKTYQVLVGPYGDDQRAEAAHKSLASHGFTPRSYERGKRDFALPRELLVGGKRLPAGYCVISWESYLPDAVVKIEAERGVGVTLDGKWVRRPVNYTENAVAYQANGDGTRTLVEIRFSGMQQALVFGAK
jgi:cell division protein FtsN